MADTSEVELLDEDECWRLLAGQRLGRLAIIHIDGAPDIFPVNFITHERAILLRTANDAKLRHLSQHPDVAFEVDGEDGPVHWSVVVRGRARRVTDTRVIDASAIGELVSASPTAKEFALMISANAVSGRRFAKGAGAARPVKPAAPLLDESTSPVPKAPHPGPPVRIPHRPPGTD